MLPISFHTIPMERVWGGRKFESFLGKTLPPQVPIGELWEVVDRAEAQSLVQDGEYAGMSLHDLWSLHRERVFGICYADCRSHRFPLLAKILDAQEKLSVQVHPPARLAESLQGEPKTEVWYFLKSKPDAKVYAGLKKQTTKKDFAASLQSGDLENLLHCASVETGQSLFISSGRIHAIGAGNLIVEIQQNSDTTYRVFDWNRQGLDGAPRQLHIDESLASIDFNDFEPRVASRDESLVADCPFFHVEKIRLESGRDVRPSGRFSLVVPVENSVICGGREFAVGNFFLLPANILNLEVYPNKIPSTILSCTLPLS